MERDPVDLELEILREENAVLRSDLSKAWDRETELRKRLMNMFDRLKQFKTDGRP